MEESINNFKADLNALVDKYNIVLKEHDLYVDDVWKGFYYTIVVNGIDTGNTADELLASF